MPTVEEHRRRLEAIKRKKPQEASITVCLEPALLRELEEAQFRGASATEKAEIQGRIDAATETITMRSIGRLRFDKLVREHPATDEQQKEHKEQFGEPAPYNVDTFSPALVASSMVAAVIDPLKCTDDEWDELYNETAPEVLTWADEWNAMEFVPLWTAAIAANTATNARALGKAFG